MMDLDHVAEVNKLHGHAGGDKALVTFAKLLQRNLRPTDMVARYGGEEFGAFLPRTDLPEARRIAHRLRTDLAGQTIHINGAPGISTGGYRVWRHGRPSSGDIPELVGMDVRQAAARRRAVLLGDAGWGAYSRKIQAAILDSPPAWIDLQDGSVAPFPSGDGDPAVVALAQFVMAGMRNTRPVAALSDNDDYCSGSLELLCNIAAAEAPSSHRSQVWL